MRSYDPNTLYLNIGSSLFARKNWRVLDYANPTSGYGAKDTFDNALLDYNVDLTTCPKLPIEDRSVDLLFTAHCLEHIGDRATRNVFREARRILKEGGVFRVVVPDAALAYAAYKNCDINWFERMYKDGKHADWSLEEHLAFVIACRGIPARMQKDVHILLMDDFLEKYHTEPQTFANHDFSQHITWFTFGKIRRFAEEAGFTSVRRSLPHESISEEMRAPEFDTHEDISLCVDICA